MGSHTQANKQISKLLAMLDVVTTGLIKYRPVFCEHKI